MDIFFIVVVLFIVLIPILGIGGFGYLIFRSIKKGQKRVQGIQNFAREMNWQYLEKVPLANLRGTEHFYLFSLGNSGDPFRRNFTIKLGNFERKRIEHLVHGAMGNFQVSIFDYVYTTGSGKTHKGHHQTVVMIDSNSLNLPLFSMRPEGAWQEIGQMFGGQDIDFPSHPNFSNKYLLRGANEAHIRHTFDPQLLSYLETTEGLSLEGGSNRIFAYRHKVLTDSAQFRRILDEAMNAANLLAN
jgi:hypothetical protein